MRNDISRRVAESCLLQDLLVEDFRRRQLVSCILRRRAIGLFLSAIFAALAILLLERLLVQLLVA